jgi:phage tail-like protein
MRGIIDGLASPHPLGPALPAMFADDDFAQRFTSAFDEVLAPVLATLDNFDAYLDPGTAPEDFVEWLAGWVGLALDDTWPSDRRRLLVSRAVPLYQWRGTVRGLAEHVAIYAGVEPEILENGGTAWSPVPGGPLPGVAEPRLLVRLAVPDPKSLDTTRLDRVIMAAKPAHLAHAVEVLKA